MKFDRVVDEPESINHLSNWRLPLCTGFTYGGILAGLVLGIYEAVLLHSTPRSAVARPDVGLLIFLAAPLTDFLAFGILGLVLGYIAETTSSLRGWYVRWLCAAGLGSAGGFAFGVFFLRLRWDRAHRTPLLAFVIIAGSVAVSLFAGTVLRNWEHRRGAFSADAGVMWVRKLGMGAVAIGLVLIGCVAVYEVRGPEHFSDPRVHFSNTSVRPNIVLITLDTATADHFSCYGYSRQTTPNIDRLARRGVQFDNAVAPSSWTLPSFASIFTGLFPHQHGADSLSPLAERFQTIAKALKSAGYQTAGFNANPVFGQAGTGIAQGFDTYEDGTENLRQNFGGTLIGHAFDKLVYKRFIHPNWLERQDAEEINGKVIRWYSHRTRQPYLLFVNYFDVHSPYLAPSRFAHHFGELSDGMARRFEEVTSKTDRYPFTPAEQASLVAGYDNGLAYADSQIGILLETLAKSADWSNTVVIITADHGEAFGQHGLFAHGMNLWRELVHVPLIILGPGVPAGLRIHDVVATQRLYATILGLAEGSKRESPRPYSLQSVWSGVEDSKAVAGPAISELNALSTRNTYISVTTPRWHWILDAQGHTQLFDWVTDPQERSDLAGSPGSSAVEETLQRALREFVMTSARPWAGLSYLRPIGLGSAPSTFPRDRDLLDSLPYF